MHFGVIAPAAQEGTMMFWLPLTGAMPQPALMPLGNGVVLVPLLLEPLAPEAPLPPDAPDALPLIVAAPVDAPDPIPEVATPEEIPPLVPEATAPLAPVAEAPVVVPEEVALPVPAPVAEPVVLEVPEPEDPLPEVPIVGPVDVPQAHSPMARRPRYPNQRIVRDLSDDFITPE